LNLSSKVEYVHLIALAFVYVTYTTISSREPFVNHYFNLFYGVAQLPNSYGVAYTVVVTVVVESVVVVESIVVDTVVDSSVCSVVVDGSEQHERMVVPLVNSQVL
jgi:hypothetical protein